MSTDFHELLTGLREIYQIANFDPDNDMSMDLGQNLCDIESIAADLLQKSGWELPKNELEFYEETDRVRVEYDLSYWGGDYSDVGETVVIKVQLPVDENSEEEVVESVFFQQTNIKPEHIIHYEVLTDDDEDETQSA
jgi:hypothetical protein